MTPTSEPGDPSKAAGRGMIAALAHPSLSELQPQQGRNQPQTEGGRGGEKGSEEVRRETEKDGGQIKQIRWSKPGVNDLWGVRKGRKGSRKGWMEGEEGYKVTNEPNIQSVHPPPFSLHPPLHLQTMNL